MRETTEQTLIAICELAGNLEYTTQAEHDIIREAAWLTMHGQPATIVKLPGDERRWRLLTATTDMVLVALPLPVLTARTITQIADDITTDEAIPDRGRLHTMSR